MLVNKKKPVFTRVTLDFASLQAVKKVQGYLPNYDVNDAVKFILGLGVQSLDNINLGVAREPDEEEKKVIDEFMTNPQLIGESESKKLIKKLKKAAA